MCVCSHTQLLCLDLGSRAFPGERMTFEKIFLLGGKIEPQEEKAIWWEGSERVEETEIVHVEIMLRVWNLF